jgi:uncharacterized membrane protein YfcA
VIELSPFVTPLGILALVLAALLAGMVDAIAGGGGVITLPALLAAGLPPHLALGTNKGQSVFGSLFALVRYRRAGLVHDGRARVALPCGLLGALLGAQLVLLVPADALRPVVLVLLPLATAAVLLGPYLRAGTAKPEPRHALWLTALVATAIGAYDGFFGPGTGTFLIAAFVVVLHEPAARASADAKVVNFASNLASVVLFASAGVVVWTVALPMALGQLAGAWLGTHLVLRGGDRVVRTAVVLVALALIAKLAADMGGP